MPLHPACEILCPFYLLVDSITIPSDVEPTAERIRCLETVGMDVDAVLTSLRFDTDGDFWRMVDLLRDTVRYTLLCIIRKIDSDHTSIRPHAYVDICMIETVQHSCHHPDCTIDLVQASDESYCLPLRSNIHSDRALINVTIEKV